MSDETEPRTGTEPYTALVFTIGTGIMLAIVILAVGVVAAWNDTDATSGASRDEAALEGGEGNHTELDFGEPAEPATANRVIEMEMLDSSRMRASWCTTSRSVTGRHRRPTPPRWRTWVRWARWVGRETRMP